jgi:hypothetical protein
MGNLFVTYEQSLALKELGFDEPCFRYTYVGDTGNNVDHIEEVKFKFSANYNADLLCISTPLKSQVFQWFRDTHKIFPEILTDCTTEPKFCYTYTRFFGNPNDLASEEWGWENTIGQYSLLYRTYPEAESECIDKLIEIIRSEQK